MKEKVQRATRNMFKQQEHTTPFLTHSMARKKTVCCGALAILLVLVAAVCVTLITLLLTRKTAPGDKKHTQQVRCLQMASQRVHFCTSVFLTGLEPTPVPSQETEHKPYLVGVGRADCTGPPAEIPLVSRGTHVPIPVGPQLEL